MMLPLCDVINPWRASAVRVTVVALSVCVSVTPMGLLFIMITAFDYGYSETKDKPALVQESKLRQTAS